MNTNEPIAKKLTKREKELVVLIADGHTDGSIGQLLEISINTVSTHRKKLLKKLDAKNSSHLVKKACLMGLIH